MTEQVQGVGTERLLPCPFCDEKRISLNEPTKDYRYGSINCPACLAVMPGEVRDRNELIGCWNTRPSPDSKLEAYRKALEELIEPYRLLTEEALRAGVLMEYGPPKPERGLAILSARKALAVGG